MRQQDGTPWWGWLLVVGLSALTACDREEVDRSAGGTGGVAGTAGTGGSGAAGASGGTAPVTAPEITKFDLLGAGAGSELHDEICAAHERAAGCDLCEALGLYDDLECDSSLVDVGLCAGPDPGCNPQAADYYVAPGGDDADDGSESQPFATIQQAQDVAQPGDLIYLRGGTHQPSEPTVFRAEGTAAEPIILQAYPGERPVVDASLLPEGDTEGGSTPTWSFDGAKHWQIRGPLELTNGRGAGVLIQEDTHYIDFVFVESSYNGQTAARAGHGFLIVEDEWADAQSIRFVNCDAHHNANHRTRSGENVAENLYQHGDGWRIKSGSDIRLIGCRSYHNLDDNYDLVWATEPVSLYQCWSGMAGYDDDAGSMTGTPSFAAAWGEGIKLGYTDDAGAHHAVRCLSWRNVHLGFRMDGGPYLVENCGSYANGRRALGWDLGPRPHLLQNNVDLDTYRDSDIPETTASHHNSWDADSPFSVTAADFASLNDALLLGPRSSDGSLPVSDFMRLVDGSDLIDAGAQGSSPYGGAGPDIGCFERF